MVGSLGTAEDNTRLSAILFKESLSNKAFLQGWHFEQDGENNSRESIGFDKEVKDIRGDGQRTLYLVPTVSACLNGSLMFLKPLS